MNTILWIMTIFAIYILGDTLEDEIVRYLSVAMFIVLMAWKLTEWFGGL